MLFNTWEFALFFGIVFAAYHLMAKRSQNLLLLGASYFFYGWWDWRFCSLLALSTVVDYTVARLMVNHTGRKRKALLLVSVITNLSILGFFKYFNFFMDSTANMVELIHQFREQFPDAVIVVNQGLGFIGRYAPYVDAVMIESFTLSYNFDDRTYFVRNPSSLDHSFRRITRDLLPALKSHPLKVLVLDYCGPNDLDAMRTAKVIVKQIETHLDDQASIDHCSLGPIESLKAVLSGHLQFGKWVQAHQHMDNALQHPDYAVALARSLRNAEQVDEAVSVLDRYIDAHPDNALLHYEAGILELSRNRNEEARRRLEASLKFGADQVPQAHAAIGRLLARQGDYHRAVEAYRQAIVIRSDLAWRYELADLYQRAGQADSALKSYRIIAQNHPTEATAIAKAANLLIELQRDAQAIKLLDKLVALEPDVPQHHLQYARVAARLGKLESARAHCRAALRLSPQWVEAQDLMLYLGE